MNDNEADIIENITGGHGKVLAPLGDTPNLSREERSMWNEWNHKVVELVEDESTGYYINGQVNEKKVCLTFDDAPDNKNTLDILRILKYYKIKASFSIVGVYAEELPDITGRIFDEGHLVFNHTWNHFDLTTLDEESMINEIKFTEERIYCITGQRTALLRPPYGSVNRRVIDILNKNGYFVIGWSINTFDWLEKTKQNIVRNVTENVRPGDIVLLHSYENKEPTVNALPEIIEKLSKRGYQFVDVAEMLEIRPYR